METKDFLNKGILGFNIPPANGRGFRALNTDILPIPDYDGKFFETFPTVWANAYAFRKELERGDARTVEEWATLFLLRFFGIVHLAEYSQTKLQNEYDRDLWLALHGTFPRSKGDEGELSSIYLLETDDKTVIGAAYPQTVFFPSRGRELWAKDKSLEPHLDGLRLSWQKSIYLIEDEHDRNRFHQHLRSLVTILPLKSLKDNLDKFADEKFPNLSRPERIQYPSDPPQIPGGIIVPPTTEELLEAYPLRKKKADGGTIYYLFTEMDLSGQPEWVTKRPTDSRFPAPSNYSQTQMHPRQIFAKLGGKLISCDLNEKDEIVRLKDLFLQTDPAWCKIGKSGGDFVSYFNEKHEIVLHDPSLREGEKAVCLAPVNEKFLAHFPETLSNASLVRATLDNSGRVRWSFTVCGKEVTQIAVYKSKTDGLNSTALGMYPPQVSPQWKIYAAHGRGNTTTSGRWHLIDENGMPGEMIEIDADNYYSVIHENYARRDDWNRPVWQEKSRANRPRAVMVKLPSNTERGVLFLKEFSNRDLDTEQKATLAMDFGTSNTCLAVKSGYGDAETVKFSLSPIQLWGIIAQNEMPGFVPNKWSGEKGFFPTILLSRMSDERLPDLSPYDIKLEHLFKVDLPSLHKDMSQALFEKQITDNWRRHENLKWTADERTPWRELFLQLTLLYAHAEVFFKKQAKIDRYVFTFPLAFSDEYGSNYHDKATDAIRQIRRYCYGEGSENVNYIKVDESTAIAKSLGQNGMKGSLEVFVDIGGGTADIAVRHEKDFLVLDSLKIAGNIFFNVAQNTLRNSDIAGSAQFRKHLQQLLGIDPLDPRLKDMNLKLGSLYSLKINELEDKVFRDREFGILKERMGDRSFQRYRAQLFFQHLLTYALLQACASVIEQKVSLSNGISLILGGNGWGLLLFAEWERSKDLLKSKAEHILRLLKTTLAKVVTDEEKPFLEKISISSLQLLNEKNLTEAKSRVALGALRASESNGSLADTEPFAGITIRDLQVNENQPRTVRWCERWRTKSFTQSEEDQIPQINSANFAHPEELNEAIDETMKIFTGLGNTSDLRTDNMPADAWQQINGQLINGIQQMKIDGKRLAVPNPHDEKENDSAAPSNFFLVRVLYNDQPDFLEVLAEKNGNFNNHK